MGVLLAEHRLERCLAAADRVIALDARADRLRRLARAATASGRSPPTPSWRRPGRGCSRSPGSRRRRSRPRRRAGPWRCAGIEPPAAAGPRAGAGADAARRRRARRAGARRPRPLGRARRRASAPREVLRGLDLAIEPGERVALMGRNGAGKSTLLRAAAGLVEPARGSIAAPRGLRAAAAEPDRPARPRARRARSCRARPGGAALEAVGLDWAVDSDPRDLSGGERERLALAIVMAGARRASCPGLICLDEPTRGMDAARKRELCDWLAELAAAGSAVARRHPRRRVRGPVRLARRPARRRRADRRRPRRRDPLRRLVLRHRGRPHPRRRRGDHARAGRRGSSLLTPASRRARRCAGAR